MSETTLLAIEVAAADAYERVHVLRGIPASHTSMPAQPATGPTTAA